MPKTTTQTQLAVTPAAPENDNAALLALTEDAGGEVYDGYSDATKDKVRIGRRLYNLSGKQGDASVQVAVNQWFDTRAESVANTLDCVFLTMRAHRAFTEYNNGAGRNEYICSSPDKVTGTIEASGVQRPCKGCPDNVWHVNGEGKRVVNCSELYTLLAVDTRTHEPFLTTFKNTANKALLAYLAKHHDGRLVLKSGKRTNVPLYFYNVAIGLELSDNGKFATPVFTKGAPVSREMAAQYRDTIEALSQLSHRDEQAATAAPVGDTSFDYGANG